MSIPERLWRLARGHWVLAQERLSDAERELDANLAERESVEQRVSEKIDAKLAEAAAFRELADVIRQAPPPRVETTGTGRTVTGPAYEPTGAGHDPLEACYLLIRIQPGADLHALENAYQARLAELSPERYPAGSSERAAIEGRRAALDAAYNKLRDVLNPTETRFERLEF